MAFKVFFWNFMTFIFILELFRKNISNIEPFFNQTHNESDFQKSDWWETAFKPKFSIKECRDILDISIGSTDSSVTLPSDEINNFKNVKEVSKNIDNDQNLYRRLWREQRFVSNDFTKLKSALSESYLSKLVHVDEGCEKSTQTKECIWNANEIKIIRSSIKDFKKRDIKLTTQVKELTARNEYLTGKIENLHKRFEKKKNILNEAVKANERFHILSETLSSQLEESKARNTFLLNHKTALSDQSSKTNILIEQLKEQIVEKDSELHKLQKIIHETEKKFQHRMDIRISDLENKHKLQQDSLQTQLDEMKIELFKEKELHSATNRGFQQLLKHFSDKSSVTTPDRNAIDITRFKFTHS